MGLKWYACHYQLKIQKSYSDIWLRISQENNGCIEKARLGSATGIRVEGDSESIK